MASPKPKPGEKLINLVIPSEIHRKLKVLGAELGRTQPSLVTEALEHWLDSGQVPKEPKEMVETAAVRTHPVPREPAQSDLVPQTGGQRPHAPIETEAEPRLVSQSPKELGKTKPADQRTGTTRPQRPDPQSLLRIDILRALNDHPLTSSELTVRAGPGDKNFDRCRLNLLEKGFIRGSRKGTVTTWYITDAGKGELTRSLEIKQLSK